MKAEAGGCCYVTAPDALPATDLRGGTITLRATLTPTDDDPKFAWVKRPHLVTFMPAPTKEDSK